MSAALVRDFLPGAERLVGPTLWTAVFPTSVEQLCPPPHLSLQILQERMLMVMWPAASVCILLGVIIGFMYGASLLCEALTSQAKKGTFTWGCAFLWYGMMSVGGLFYHCIYPRRMFHLLDIVSTACACVSLLAVYWIFLNADDRNTRFRSSMVLGYGLLACLGIDGGDTVKSLLYIVPSGLAISVGVYFVVKVMRKGVSVEPHARAWLACASLSALIALVSIPLDSWLCFTLGGNFSMIFWFFLGCDFAMVCLYHFTVAVFETGPKLKGL